MSSEEKKMGKIEQELGGSVGDVVGFLEDLMMSPYSHSEPAVPFLL